MNKTKYTNAPQFLWIEPNSLGGKAPLSATHAARIAKCCFIWCLSVDAHSTHKCIIQTDKVLKVQWPGCANPGRKCDKTIALLMSNLQWHGIDHGDGDCCLSEGQPFRQHHDQNIIWGMVVIPPTDSHKLWGWLKLFWLVVEHNTRPFICHPFKSFIFVNSTFLQKVLALLDWHILLTVNGNLSFCLSGCLC